MFELCRKIVAGPKKKLQWNDKQLDLTYVTDRIIAMAFPASGIQSAYRNSIKDVSQYLNQKHGNNYLVVNVSSRKYDYKYFSNRVIEYEWRDHLSPTLATLFMIAKEMYDFLKKNKHNVVAVHCNHGKGRTGTTIIAFLMFTGFFEKFDEALTFYNKRRFISLTYGVSQPCQKRYLGYFQTLRKKETVSPKLVAYRLSNIRHKGLPNQKYFIEITAIRTLQKKYRKVHFPTELRKCIPPNIPIMGDICIQLCLDKWNGDDEVAMINCHTYFLDDSYEKVNVEELMVLDEKQRRPLLNGFSRKQERYSGRNIKIQGKHSSEFEIIMEWEWYCLCHFDGMGKKECPCQKDRAEEEKQWGVTLGCLEASRKISKLQGCGLLFNYQYLHNQQYEQQQPSPQCATLTKPNNANNPKPQQQKSTSCPSNQSSNTLTSPLSSQQKQLPFFASKQFGLSESQKLEFPNSLPDSINHKTEDHFDREEFQYDMVIVNRNSTGSV